MNSAKRDDYSPMEAKYSSAQNLFSEEIERIPKDILCTDYTKYDSYKIKHIIKENLAEKNKNLSNLLFNNKNKYEDFLNEEMDIDSYFKNKNENNQSDIFPRNCNDIKNNSDSLSNFSNDLNQFSLNKNNEIHEINQLELNAITKAKELGT